MTYFDWNKKKNEKLKKERSISFEEVVQTISTGKFVNIEKNTKKKYRHQKIFIVIINNYAYLVPFVKDKDKIFLKTIFPSRKATKKIFT